MQNNANVLATVLNWPRSTKQIVVVALDACLGVLAMWMAFSLRLDTFHWPEELQWIAYAIAPALAFPILVNQGLYRAIFRYTGISALITTGKAVAIYGAMLFAILLYGQWVGVPRSVGILQPLIFLLLIGSSRALGWLLLKGRPTTATRRLLVYGAGNAGAQTAAGLAGSQQYQLQGFLDDDPTKTGRSINGVRVHNLQSMPQLVEQLGVTDILLAIPSASRQRRRQIIETLRELPVRIRTLPGLNDLASGRVTLTDFQDLDIEDLLGREPVAADPELLRRNLTGQVIMVTGAGGSIGSELCRQILTDRPRTLLLVEHSELALYSIHQELLAQQRQQGDTSTLVPLLASIVDAPRLKQIVGQYQPTSIYHAAAYKHVPMVEANVSAGILNNVFGTLNLAKAAIAHRVANFVLISTDKAVRPTNVMGASKRIAEMILQALAAESPAHFDNASADKLAVIAHSTRFSMVRFGNVLGSSGSVIPLFRKQIAAGGPITVTDANVTRYFMTIPEAAQLVLQASAMADSGDLFLLDMGEPIRILDLAHRMVTLSGLTVRDAAHAGGDIAIEFSGLRPGEKLFEELLIGDNPQPTDHPRILRAREEFLPWCDLQSHLNALQTASHNSDDTTVKQLLEQLVNGYQPRKLATSCLS